MARAFQHIDLKLVIPRFDSRITDLIIDLDCLRKKRMGGTTPYIIFLQLKDIFHFLESIGSARIEGNRTTVAEFVETLLEHDVKKEDNILEIDNMDKAMDFIDSSIKSSIPIDHAFIRELHKLTVKDLSYPPNGEGDRTPGVYRQGPISISGSDLVPPEAIRVQDYMDELIAFINKEDSSKYDLIKMAIAHHRFVWIHPFNNGNGRTVRLFTYAMLVKQEFHVEQVNRIINPTAIFCSDRDKYNQLLSSADSGSEKNILRWCEYVLAGLKQEIEKVDKLTEYNYLKKEILLPTISYSLERGNITELESKILKKTVEKKVIQASDINEFFPNKSPQEISRQIKRLKIKKMLQSEIPGNRKYVIGFRNNVLLRGVIKFLGEKGFLPIKD